MCDTSHFHGNVTCVVQSKAGQTCKTVFCFLVEKVEIPLALRERVPHVSKK